jgi:hypothetical protein
MCAVTVCNITIHALVMTLVVHVARAADKKTHNATIIAIGRAAATPATTRWLARVAPTC